MPGPWMLGGEYQLMQTIILMQNLKSSFAVRIQVEVFWVMMPCSVAVGYQRFRGPPFSCHNPEDLDLSYPVIYINCKLFENVKMFKFLEMTKTNESYIHGETISRLSLCLPFSSK